MQYCPILWVVPTATPIGLQTPQGADGDSASLHGPFANQARHSMIDTMPPFISHDETNTCHSAEQCHR